MSITLTPITPLVVGSPTGTSLADITLRVARKVTDVMESVATAGGAGTLTDTVRLNQVNGYWKNGTLWVLSGTYIGNVYPIAGYNVNILTITGPTFTVGVRYAAARSLFDFYTLRQYVNNVLQELLVEKVDSTLTGDGTTKTFTLPTGVSKVEAVDFTDSSGNQSISNHWQLRGGAIVFRQAPGSAYTINLTHLATPTELVASSNTVDPSINLDWLMWATVAQLLEWALVNYQNDPTLKIDERLNQANQQLAAKRPFSKPRVTVITAG